jgi:DNA-binding response OmpR family regulator
MAKILIIEDQAPLCSLYKTVLSKFDHQIVFATTGETGLQAAAADRPDLILLDLFLPDMSGSEVAQKLRDSGFLPEVPLIITTALDEASAQHIAADVGAAAILNKPFSVAELVESMTRVLNASPQKSQPPGPASS